MFKCENCRSKFDKPKRDYETHGFSYPPYEEIEICPVCKVAGMIEVVEEDCEDDDY